MVVQTYYTLEQIRYRDARTIIVMFRLYINKLQAAQFFFDVNIKS